LNGLQRCRACRRRSNGIKVAIAAGGNAVRSYTLEVLCCNDYILAGTVATLGGCVVTLSGTSSGTAATDPNGGYRFEHLPGGTYTVKPSKSGYWFEPESRSVAVNQDRSGVDFVAHQYEPPVANFSANPTSGPAPLVVQFTDGSSGVITGWDWTFGDGGSSNEKNPVHTYGQIGTYTVTLQVTGPGGNDTKTTVSYITAVEPTPVVSSFAVNNGAASTTSTTVTLNNTVTMATPTDYMASESAGFAGAGAAWQSYSMAPSFTFSSGYGTKTAYFKVKNGSGTESAVVQDDITVIEIPPVKSILVSPSGPITTNTPTYIWDAVSILHAVTICAFLKVWKRGVSNERNSFLCFV
jgi:hypothetical protein